MMRVPRRIFQSSTHTDSSAGLPDPEDNRDMSSHETAPGSGMSLKDGNPLVGLAVAAINAILYVLDQFKNLVTWCTITFPG